MRSPWWPTFAGIPARVPRRSSVRRPYRDAWQRQASSTAGSRARGGRRSVHRGEASSSNEGWRNKSFRNYADYMQTADFCGAMEQLSQVAETRRTAVMCSESVFWRCHRRLISDYVTALGGCVVHIFPGGPGKPHALTEGAVVETLDPVRIAYPGKPDAVQ